jgi:nitroreductase
MSFEELTALRGSVRDFAGRAVEAEKVEGVLRAANAAPSAGDLQAYEVVCVTDREVREALAEAAFNQRFVAQAPLVLVFFANPPRSAARYGPRGASLYCVQDATIACAYAELAVADLGLGSVWVGSFDGAGVSRAVGARDDVWPVAMLPIGYATRAPVPSPRRELSELVHIERFREVS